MTATTRVSSRQWVTALIGGMLVWFARLILATVLVRPACALGPVAGVSLLLGVSLVALAGIAVCWRISVRVRRAGDADGADHWQAVGVMGITLSALAAALVVTETSSIFFVDPCR